MYDDVIKLFEKYDKEVATCLKKALEMPESKAKQDALDVLINIMPTLIKAKHNRSIDTDKIIEILDLGLKITKTVLK